MLAKPLTFIETSAMLELARGLTEVQKQILFTLADKGPAVPLEIAVRSLRFPEEVAEPLADLRQKQLVATTGLTKTMYGNEIVSLTSLGSALVTRLRDESFSVQVQSIADAAMRGAPDPRQDEVDLLKKLGDLAAQQGDLAKASQYYQQALEATRSLFAAPVSP
jgi:DNA-binding MarR family transcriptional regulator